jgi:hypothetical protein
MKMILNLVPKSELPSVVTLVENRAGVDQCLAPTFTLYLRFMNSLLFSSLGHLKWNFIQPRMGLDIITMGAAHRRETRIW